MKRLGYIGIILAYLILAFTAVCFTVIMPEHNKLLLGLLVSVGILLLVVSGWLAARENTAAKNKLDSCLETICWLPIVVIVGIPLIITVFFEMLFYSIRYNFKKQSKPLKEAGFALSARKEGKERAYLFTKDSCVIKIIPHVSYQISFDQGESFVDIVDSKLGTYEERQYLAGLVRRHNTCDYRDKDMHALTPAFVKFLTDNL